MEPLWNDTELILDALLEKRHARHFLGAIVLQQEQTSPGEVERRQVIDGQQRLTTLQILFAAAINAAVEAGATQSANALRELVRNSENIAEPAERSKVVPTIANREAFELVMAEGGPPPDAPDDPNNSIQEAYAYFSEVIKAWALNGGPDAIEQRYKVLRDGLMSQLQVVSINLEAGDDAQVIFETLNARGTPLLEIDLVKNATFHRASMKGVDTDALHDNVWMPELGSDYWRKEVRQGRLMRPRAEVFLTHWLSMKTRKIVSATELFGVFRSRQLDAPDAPPAEQTVHELCDDAQVMRGFDDMDATSVAGRFFRVMGKLDTTTIMPLALLLFRAPEVSPDGRDRALAALESYLIRRMIVGLTTKDYNRLGADLVDAAWDRLHEADEAVIETLCSSRSDTRRWPTDEDVRSHVATQGLYNWLGRQRIVLLLSEIERKRRLSTKSESIDLPAKLSIEHLMPQTWETNWPLASPTEEATENRKSRINLLGNLTLVTGGLNSALSNSAWNVKRGHLQNNSTLLLNSEVCALEEWDEQAIDDRGGRLTDEILALWPGPKAFNPSFDPDRVLPPDGELSPEYAELTADEVRQILQDGPETMRALLAHLSEEPGRKRTYADVEDAMGWSRGHLGSVCGGYANFAKARFDGRRPYRILQDEDDVWWIWLDDERAGVVRTTPTPA